MHKSGFVCLIGKPNAGKSTLLNTILGEKLVITSHKAQTTRHRIFGIFNDDNYQIIFSDTPGLITPEYGLHKRMMGIAYKAIDDCDIVMWIADINDDPKVVLETFKELNIKKKVFLVLNKVESQNQLKRVDIFKDFFKNTLDENRIINISAKDNKGVDDLLFLIKQNIQDSPPFYDKEQIAVEQTKFFVAEFIRETVFEMFDQELPYQTAVIISDYTEKEDLDVIYSQIIVERETQKGIIIGHNGSKIKELGKISREKIERFLDKHVFLDLQIKVRPNWRNKENFLNEYGY